MSSTTKKYDQIEPGERTSVLFWVGLLVLLGATGYVVTSSMESAVHYYDVNEIYGVPQHVGEHMRLRGTVVEGSHRIREGTLDEHVFLIDSEGKTITVLYSGAVPDQFKAGAEVIATGELVDEETFEAESITAQCPSRYENAAPTADENMVLGGAEPMTGGPETTTTGTNAPIQPSGPYLSPRDSRPTLYNTDE